MEFRFAFLAKAAEVSPSGTFSVLGAGFTTAQLSQLPGSVDLVVIAQFAVAPNEYEKEHRFTLEVYDPQQQLLPGALEGQGTPRKDPVFPSAPLHFTFFFNLSPLFFPGPGEYRFRILVNGKESGAISLHVAKQQEQT